MNRFRWFFMSGRKKLLYQIECAKANKQRLMLSNGVVLDFTEDQENLIKERDGLKRHCAEYKRKYKALRRVLGRLHYHIEGRRVQWGLFAGRIKRTSDSGEIAVLTALMKQNTSEREELQNIYDMCREVDR